MKCWYIILSDSEQKCDFVSLQASGGFVTLKWPTGVNVKIRIHNFKVDYNKALNGEEVTAFAMSSKNRRIGKPIKIIFK
jgi:hypothetical protein